MMVAIGGLSIVGDGVSGVVQIDPTHVQVKYYNGKTCTIANTSADEVFAKINAAKAKEAETDSA